MEIWKDIPNFKGYQASNEGRIRTHNKITYTEKHGERHWKDRVLKQKYSAKDKCYRVELWKNGKHKTYLVHRLIASTFLENNLETKLTVNHKDGNRKNNHIENLEWMTIRENIQHGFENNLFKQKNCIIENKNGESKTFNSLSKASQFLGRNKGYIWNRLKNNKPIYDANGESYKFYFKKGEIK